MQSSAKLKVQSSAKWSPPRGIRLLQLPEATNRPHGVQWRVEGKRKTKGFESKELQTEFARSLAGSVKQLGVDAYRLDTDEARDWRAFRARLDGATLDDVLACWSRHGKADNCAITVADAVKDFTAAKVAEGVAKTYLAHCGTILDRFCAVHGAARASTITREQIVAWVAGLKCEESTRRTSLVRVRTLFQWLKVSRLVPDSPCDGIKPPKITQEDVAILTVDQARALFRENDRQPVELLGRLALEAFAGLRFSSATQVTAADIDFAAGGINLPAAKIKTRRRQYIDGLPQNLWAWLKWSNPAAWSMTPRQYLQAKSLAFVRAKTDHPHNALRHSFASYHCALGKDAGRTATILCHTSPKMLYSNYKGRATKADGAEYFKILP